MKRAVGTESLSRFARGFHGVGTSLSLRTLLKLNLASVLVLHLAEDQNPPRCRQSTREVSKKNHLIHVRVFTIMAPSHRGADDNSDNYLACHTPLQKYLSSHPLEKESPRFQNGGNPKLSHQQKAYKPNPQNPQNETKTCSHTSNYLREKTTLHQSNMQVAMRPGFSGVDADQSIGDTVSIPFWYRQPPHMISVCVWGPSDRSLFVLRRYQHTDIALCLLKISWCLTTLS